MGEFQRSPSKVWWAQDDSLNHSLNWRAASGSPGSQDSGFSDTETTTQIPQNEKAPSRNEEITSNDLIKTGSTHKNNLTSNINEKLTPTKSITLNLNASKRRPPDELLSPQHMYISPKISLNCPILQAKSEPAGRFIKNKNCQKVSRNLFRSIQMESTVDVKTNQYAESMQHSINSRVTSNENTSSWTSSDSEQPDCIKTLPLASNANNNYPPNLSAPAILDELYDEAVTSFNNNSSTSSDCDSELECLFQKGLDSPTHTSTPKTSTAIKRDTIKLGKIHAMNLLQKYRNDRVPPISVETVEEGTALQKWMDEIKPNYEPECMTTLQCKSIAGELGEKVSELAAKTASSIRQILNYNKLIEKEFDNLKNASNHEFKTLVSLIQEFLQKFKIQSCLQTQFDNLKQIDPQYKSHATAEIHIEWNSLQHKLLASEIKNIISDLQTPRSEMDVRAKLTSLTSIALRNDNLVELFITSGAVQVICTVLEKCEGSSVRALAFRALSTLCTNAEAIRKFENSDGMQILTECLIEESRPEPERTETVALLAQITAPWIDDNHNVQGLHKQSKKLVKSLTKFATSTQCSQNLLLCIAALANLTAMDPKCIKYLLHQDTARILLETVKRHGQRGSIYLLEQLATLITNMSSSVEARVVLTQNGAAGALLCFLQSSCMDDEVVKRLHQKSMIGLSRLCGEKDAAEQIVRMGGVEKLVKLCKEKSERFDSNAILVAALATLRKIAEVCGLDVVNEEDAQELIQPKLLDSFRAYSVQKQSLV